MTEKNVNVSLAALSHRMKHLREEWGQTQRGMARLLKCSLTAWQSYENGTSYPGGKTLIALWERGVNINWVLTGDGLMQPSAEADWLTTQYYKREAIAEEQKEFISEEKPQWPFPWPHHPMLMQTVIEGVEESIVRQGLQGKFSLRKKAKTMVSIYEALIPDYADGTKTIEEDDGLNIERLTGTVRLIAG